MKQLIDHTGIYLFKDTLLQTTDIRKMANGQLPHDLNCLTIGELEELARERMDKQTRDYYNEVRCGLSEHTAMVVSTVRKGESDNPL